MKEVLEVNLGGFEGDKRVYEEVVEVVGNSTDELKDKVLAGKEGTYVLGESGKLEEVDEAWLEKQVESRWLSDVVYEDGRAKTYREWLAEKGIEQEGIDYLDAKDRVKESDESWERERDFRDKEESHWDKLTRERLDFERGHAGKDGRVSDEKMPIEYRVNRDYEQGEAWLKEIGKLEVDETAYAEYLDKLRKWAEKTDGKLSGDGNLDVSTWEKGKRSMETDTSKVTKPEDEWDDPAPGVPMASARKRCSAKCSRCGTGPHMMIINQTTVETVCLQCDNSVITSAGDGKAAYQTS